ncbi:MAG TPA: response regulator transcription factor [Verrucomicrobiae bacterium]|nr:response regulator transcription factor [Verrucomicrobiae bacterium]
MTKHNKVVRMGIASETPKPVVAPSSTRKPPGKIRVAIVEDDAELLAALARLIDTDAGFQVEGRFNCSAAALEGIPRLNPDVVIMDINLPDVDGVECVRQLKMICPQPQVLMLTVYEDTEAIFSALRAGAGGYLLKQTSIEELLGALREINRGGSPMSSHIARKVVEYFKEEATPNKEMEMLSAREREVLELVAEGYLFKEIADRIGVSFGTVHTYSRRIYEKLQVRSRTQAVAKFRRG